MTHKRWPMFMVNMPQAAGVITKASGSGERFLQRETMGTSGGISIDKENLIYLGRFKKPGR